MDEPIFGDLVIRHPSYTLGLGVFIRSVNKKPQQKSFLGYYNDKNVNHILTSSLTIIIIKPNKTINPSSLTILKGIKTFKTITI